MEGKGVIKGEKLYKGRIVVTYCKDGRTYRWDQRSGYWKRMEDRTPSYAEWKRHIKKRKGK